MNINRYCMDCQTPIYECMGFVLAGDFLRAIEGEITFNEIRERCYRCIDDYENQTFIGTL